MCMAVWPYSLGPPDGPWFLMGELVRAFSGWRDRARRMFKAAAKETTRVATATKEASQLTAAAEEAARIKATRLAIEKDATRLAIEKVPACICHYGTGHQTRFSAD